MIRLKHCNLQTYSFPDSQPTTWKSMLHMANSFWWNHCWQKGLLINRVIFLQQKGNVTRHHSELAVEIPENIPHANTRGIASLTPGSFSVLESFDNELWTCFNFSLVESYKTWVDVISTTFGGVYGKSMNRFVLWLGEWSHKLCEPGAAVCVQEWWLRDHTNMTVKLEM